MVVHASFLLHALTMLFESLWEKATPLAPRASDGRTGDDPRDEVLRLLTAGLKDESIARALGLSRSTVARAHPRPHGRAGGPTRFQAGILAERERKLTGEESAPRGRTKEDRTA